MKDRFIDVLKMFRGLFKFHLNLLADHNLFVTEQKAVLAELTHLEADPITRVTTKGRDLLFGTASSYAVDAGGRSGKVRGVLLQQVVSYMQRIFLQPKCVVVITGNLGEKDEVFEAVRTFFIN